MVTKQSVKINYGIFGGERQGKRLRRELHKAGYTVTKNEAEADIIIAHSAGCFWLPQAPTSQTFVLIDPPYWPGKTIRERARSKGKSHWDFRTYRFPLYIWITHSLWGTYYAVRDLRRTLQIMRFAPQYDLSKIITNHKVVLIRNEGDDWLTPNLDELLRQHPGTSLHIVPGDHDDLYYHPERYVDLLQSVV